MERPPEAEEETPAKRRCLVSRDRGASHVTDTENHAPSAASTSEDEAEHWSEEVELGGKIAEAGIVERVRLEDFMSHLHTQIDLGPNINFIIGQNGSGKSAILVALAVGLGSKAAFTSRGGRVADLIRTGAPAANIWVTIRNRGPDAWRPADFGASITVHRRLVKGGSGSWRLLAANGKQVSTLRADLTLLLDHFGIQINNPCALLMQDSARVFLTESSPHAKYGFFMRGTQLEALRKDLVQVHEALEEMVAVRKSKELQLPDHEKEVSRLRDELEEATGLGRLQAAVDESRLALAWHFVAGQEAALAATMARLQTLLAQQQARAETLEKASKTQASTLEMLSNARQQAQILQQAADAARDRMLDAARSAEQGRKAVNARRGKCEALRRSIQLLKGRLSKAETRVQQEAAAQGAMEQAAQATEHEERARAEALARQRREEEQRLALAAEELERTYEETRGRADAVGAELRDAVRKRQAADGQERTLRAQLQAGAASTFGWEGDLRALQAALAQERRFERPPIGPIGRYVRLQDGKWADAIESNLRGLLGSFVLHSHHDERIFRQLFQQQRGLGRMPAVVVQRHGAAYALPADQEPPADLLTVLRALQIEDGSVQRVLVDQAGVEGTVLMQDMAAAEDLVYKQRRPNVRRALLPTGTTLALQNNIQTAKHEKYVARFLGADVTQQLRLVAERRQQSQQLESKLSDDHRRLQAEQATAREAWEQTRRQAADASRAAQRAAADLRTLESRFRAETAAAAAAAAAPALADEAQQLAEELRGKLAAEEQKLAEVEEGAGKEAGVQAQLEARAQELQAAHEQAKAAAEDAGAALSRMEQELGRADHDSRKARAQEDAAAAQLADLRRAAEEQEQDAAATREKAHQVGPRPPAAANRSEAQLRSELQARMLRLERERASMRDPAVVLREFEAARSSLARTQQALHELATLIAQLQTSAIARHEGFREFKRSIKARTRRFFQMFLSRKGHTGDLRFSDETEELEVEVQLDSGASQAATQATQSRATNTLSGGEKSYATLALLLALWETMECPFRAMDEFDVFMDAVRRRISIDLLVSSAKLYPQRQYLFITPQDPSDLLLLDASQVRVHRLRPPVRGQQELQLGRPV